MSWDTTRSTSSAARVGAHEARQRLEHERNARLAQLRALKDTEGAGQEADDLLSAQRGAVGRALKEIEAAFARLEEGTYGLCRECSRPIPVERLEILPYASACVPCQQRAG
ncbi:TraR/DksA family transcriptional regulator [Streptomyces naganishii]|uniref:Molecular chaperone DnaK n=1 Tax=Streptomyces naganishii JCM 4654 TaxID=1306179 RepID=A0A918Y0D6_9ACTN|nr:TraR/DksA C4-type zinc finger protein [Streptomyces naganishii]GHD85447.1 molecular chaperone DnaK [Streptomyces naganishii JCM 4654]